MTSNGRSLRQHVLGNRIDSQAAPGEFEMVRRLINTWSIPNDTREPIDVLPDLTRDAMLWEDIFADRQRTHADTLRDLVQLRDDLRTSLGDADETLKRLNRWLAKTDIGLALARSDGELVLALRPKHRRFVDRIVASVAQAVANGEWTRLKACPDCRWAFYDNTRNQSKRWCTMTKGAPDGRGCGTLAKVRRFRERAAGSGE
jgi:predicted RNA-binding Zn ribbon-like protein